MMHRPFFTHKPQPPRPKQRGTTLVVVLIMLVVLTLFAVSAINIANVNSKVVGNMQQRIVAESLAQTAIETVLNSINNFGDTGRSTAVTVAAPTGMTVTIANRNCLSVEPASGYSAAVTLVPEDTFWDLKVTVNDSLTGATTVMHQGVKIRMLAGNCPA